MEKRIAPILVIGRGRVNAGDVLAHLRNEDATTFVVHVRDEDGWLDPVELCDVDAADMFASAAVNGRVAYIVGGEDATHPFSVARSMAYMSWMTGGRVKAS